MHTHPERIGSFTIGTVEANEGHRIGQGTFCDVKEGAHILTGEAVAIKIFNKDSFWRAGKGLKEWKILKELNHPHIVRVFELIQTRESSYIIMEHVENGELFDFIRANGRLSESIAKRLFRQLLAAISYLQQKSVVHRDIKPENILLASDNSIRLVDFGLSASYRDCLQLKESCGSPGYALPEMLIGKPYRPETVDVWSAGMALYAMVCGCLPFDDRTAKDVYHRILTKKLPLPQFLTSELKQLLSGILNKSIEQRYQLEQAMNHPWLLPIPKAPVNRMPIRLLPNEEILQAMTQFNIDKAYVLKSLKKNDFNFATTMYFLLQKKVEREKSEWQALRSQAGEEEAKQVRVMRSSDETSESEHGKQTHQANINPPRKTLRIHRQEGSRNKQQRSSGGSLLGARVTDKGRLYRTKKKTSSVDGTFTSHIVANDDYYRDINLKTQQSQRKKMTTYDRCPKEFVSSHEYQSVLIVRKSEKKLRKT